MCIHFYVTYLNNSTVCFVFCHIWNSNFNMFLSLSIYHFNAKTVPMLIKFHENQRPVTYLFNLLQTQGPNSLKCKIYNKNVFM